MLVIDGRTLQLSGELPIIALRLGVRLLFNIEEEHRKPYVFVISGRTTQCSGKARAAQHCGRDNEAVGTPKA